MSGFLKGATLGLTLAIALIVVVILVGPDVDPAKYSEAPEIAQDGAPKVVSPDAPDTQAELPSPDGVEAPVTPQSPDVAEAANDPDLVTTTPAIVVDPALPQGVQTPDLTAETPMEDGADADSKIALNGEASELPAEQTEAESDVRTENAGPVEATQTDPALAQPAPATDDALKQPADSIAALPLETQPEANRTQSNAEAEDGPPNVQFESPEPPRAVERPVESEGFGTRVGSFTDTEKALSNRTAGVRVNRLPNMSQEGETNTQEAVPQTRPNALRDNRVQFEANGNPLVGIILLEGNDRAEDDARLTLIADFGVPLSIGIDPTSEGASQRAQTYHAAGADIVILSDLPASAAPRDIEVILAEYQSRLPMAVAMMAKPAQARQETPRLGRTLLEHVVAILRDRGYGLVAQNRGLNTEIQLASKTGVPHVQIFHQITPEETQDRLRTIFNRTVFRASQKGAAVVTSPSDVAALAALKAWALVDRPGSVQVAPISAILLGVAPQ